MWNLKKKNGAKELIYKTEIEAKMQKTIVTQRKRQGGANREIGTDIYTVSYIKKITNKDTGNPNGKRF